MKRDPDRDLTDEVRDHLERRAADLERTGLTPDEAHRRARVEFGAVEAYKEQLRAERSWSRIARLPEQLWRDVVMALRRLRSTPGFTLFSIATLAVGIGVTTAVYSVVYALALRSAGVVEQDRVVRVRQSARFFHDFAGPEFIELARQQTSFTEVAGVSEFATSLSVNNRAELVAGEGVTGTFFPMLGVAPALGRLLTAADDRHDAPAVVVLAYATWQRRFGGSSDVLGATVRMAGRVFEVVGVLPLSFTGVSRYGRVPQGVWVPLQHAPDASRSGIQMFGRLRPGLTIVEAELALSPLARQLDAAGPLDGSSISTPRRLIVEGAFVSSRLPIGITAVIVGVPFLVLLIACSNLANLALSRGASRVHDLAVRRTLGASRARVIRELLVEGLIVASVGGAAGCAIAVQLLASGLTVIRTSIDVGPQFASVMFRLDPGVLAAAMSCALLSFLVACVAPALQLTRNGDRGVLATDTGLGAAPRWRERSNLIALQVTASVCLFLLTAVGVRVVGSENRGSAVPEELSRAAVVNVPMRLQQRDEAAVRRIVDQVLTEIRRISGVTTVAVSAMWTSASTSGVFVTTPEQPFLSGADGRLASLNVGTPAWFRMNGVEIVAGRSLDERDGPAQPLAAVINEGLAKTVFRTANVVGRTLLLRLYDWNALQMTTRSVEIVGVSRDRLDHRGRPDDGVNLSFNQYFVADVSIYGSGPELDPSSLATALRTAVHTVDRDVAVSFAGPAISTGRYTTSTVFRLLSWVMGGFATLALLLSMAGLYGVLSHAIVRRTRELGLRVALGADRARIVRLVVKDAIRPVLEGLCVGLLAATVVRFLLRATVDDAITPFDPMALVFAAGPLLIAATFACLIPALRASRVDPNVALRNL